MADSSKDLQLRELKDMINDLKKMIKTLQATVDAANKREEALTQERDNLKEEVDLLRKKLFGSSSEKYADGYEQMDLFNEAEVNADTDTAEIKEEIVISSHKREKRTGKKEEDLSNFEVTETIEYKLTGKRATADQGKHCYSCLLYTSDAADD